MPEQTTIYCAYKQGYSWLAEEMLPRLKEAGADTVTVYFKPFLPEGQTEWNDENGAIPSYHNLSAETPDNGTIYRSVICRSCTRSRIFW